MILDLRQSASIPEERIRAFNRCAQDVRGPFNAFVSELYAQLGRDRDWYISTPLSRNTYVSQLFYHCCCLTYVKALTAEGISIGEIVTDSAAMKSVIDVWCREHGWKISTTMIKPWRDEFRSLFLLKRMPIGHLARNLWRHLWARITRIQRRPLRGDSITLIGTVVMPGYIDNDRYYAGMEEFLGEKELEDCRFVPTFFGFRPHKIPGALATIRKSLKRYLLKEDYLKGADYVVAWQTARRLSRRRMSGIEYEGFDVSTLINEELSSNIGAVSVIEAVINYKFAMRLKERKVRIRLVVDWFENQVTDKAWNRGFNKFYKEVPTVGYMGYTEQPFYLCTFPTSEEWHAGVLPSRVAVIGEGMTDSVRGYCPEIPVTVAPAFRFKHLFKLNKSPKWERKTDRVLVGLPLFLEDSYGIIDYIAAAVSHLPENIQFQIKLHPGTSREKIRQYINNLPSDRISIVDGDFSELMSKCKLLVTGASSIAVETLAMGKPVIIIANRAGLTFSPIPQGIQSRHWRLCYTADEFMKALSQFNSYGDEQQQSCRIDGRNLREQMFMPVTRDTVRRFLHLPV